MKIGEEILESIVRDQSGARLQTFKMNLRDENTVTSFVRILIEKYGAKVNLEKLKNIKDKESDWLDLDNEFVKF